MIWPGLSMSVSDKTSVVRPPVLNCMGSDPDEIVFFVHACPIATRNMMSCGDNPCRKSVDSRIIR